MNLYACVIRYIAYNVLCQSIFARSSKPVTISPLVLNTLPISRKGLTEFTYSRFLVPWLCDYEGPAIFMDSDILVLGDIAELFEYYDETKAVSVVKMEKRFEWSSVTLFNCGHPANKILTPEYINDAEKCKTPHLIDWCEEDDIGELPATWNHCVFYDDPGPAFLVHYTAGIPLFPETRGCEYSDEWMDEAQKANSAVSWQELMGNSVHVGRVAEWHKKREAAAGAGQ